MVGEWVVETLEKKNGPKENGGRDAVEAEGGEEDVERPRPPLHSVVTETP
jgi:hypothetical protein